ncbi:MAG: LptA/OstA family protein [Hyphomicrobiaceae bacterium]
MRNARHHIEGESHQQSAEPDLVATERQRQRAFRAAKRHTWLVRFMKLALPVCALGSIGIYGAMMYAMSHVKPSELSVSTTRIDTKNLTMVDPRYDGFATDGTAYKVHAKSAVTDLRMNKPVRLNAIDGQIIQPNGVTTSLDAKWGTYDQKKDLLELYEQIDVKGSDGLRAHLTRATVWTKQNRIMSDQPVVAENITGLIHAKAMELDGKTRKALFKNGVEVTMKPNPQKDGPAKSPRPQVALPGMETASSEPLIINAMTLAVDDNTHIARFRQDVRARQGEAQLAAPELDVIYEPTGKKDDAATKGGNKTQAPGAIAPSALKRITARGGVEMTNRDSRATGATLDYDATTEVALLDGGIVLTQAPDRRVTAHQARIDQKNDQIALNGAVVVTQDKNVIRSGRLDIDRRQGTARFASPPGSGFTTGRIYTHLQQKVDPRQSKAKASRPAKGADSNPALGFIGGGFRSAPDQPIEIEADTLDILDSSHRAIYTGKVVAKQGNFTVNTAVLTAHYTGRTGLVGDMGQPPADGKTADAAANLKKIEARRGVVVTGNEGQRASSEWADFDVTANKVVMGGNVEITQPAKGMAPGKQQSLRLPDTMRFVIDLATGQYHTEPDPKSRAAPSGARVSGAFATSASRASSAKNGVPFCPKGAVCRADRPQLLIYPGGQMPNGGPDQHTNSNPKKQRKVKSRSDTSSWSTTAVP